MLCFSEFLFAIGQDGPISTYQYNMSICNKVFRTMFLKPDSVRIIPRGGYPQDIEALQWLAYIGRTRNNVFMPVMGGKFIWLGCLMWKSMGTVKRRMKS